MIDYIIGRLAGNYNPGNPLTYRSKYKQMDSSFDRSDSKAFSFPLDSKISIAHDSYQRNQQQQQPPNSSSVQPSITTPSKGFTTKFDRIQELARALCGHEEVQALLRDISMAFVKSGAKEKFLDSCIEELEYKINVKQVQRYLSAASIRESDKRPPLHGHHVQHLPESSRDKLTQLEQLLKIDLKNDDVAVHEEIERLLKVRNSSRDDTILNVELDNLRRRTT